MNTVEKAALIVLEVEINTSRLVKNAHQLYTVKLDMPLNQDALTIVLIITMKMVQYLTAPSVVRTVFTVLMRINAHIVEKGTL